MFHVALYQPEIPPNTGNIIRLCANAGVDLHLIHPLGFSPDDKQLQRAGLDYHIWTQINHYENFETFMSKNISRRIFACSTKGKVWYSEIHFAEDDIFLFGPETRGLPKNLIESMADKVIQIPMLPHSRSLNLSNSVAIVVYEAWRQFNFKGAI